VEEVGHYPLLPVQVQGRMWMRLWVPDDMMCPGMKPTQFIANSKFIDELSGDGGCVLNTSRWRSLMVVVAKDG